MLFYFVVQLLSCVCLFCDLMNCSTPNFCLWDFPGKNTVVGCHFLLQLFYQQQVIVECLQFFPLLSFSNFQSPSLGNENEIYFLTKLVFSFIRQVLFNGHYQQNLKNNALGVFCNLLHPLDSVGDIHLNFLQCHIVRTGAIQFVLFPWTLL